MKSNTTNYTNNNRGLTPKMSIALLAMLLVTFTSDHMGNAIQIKEGINSHESDAIDEFLKDSDNEFTKKVV